MRIWYANYISRLDKESQCWASKVVTDEDFNQGKDNGSDIKELYIRHVRAR